MECWRIKVLSRMCDEECTWFSLTKRIWKMGRSVSKESALITSLKIV